MTPLLAIALVAVACTHEPAPGESVGEVCRIENDGAEVSVSGYLLPPTLTFGCVDSCSMKLTPSKQERRGINLTFPVGDGPRTMAGIEPLESSPFRGAIEKLPANAYRLTDDDGRDLHPGNIARLTGTLKAIQHDNNLRCELSPSSVQGL